MAVKILFVRFEFYLCHLVLTLDSGYLGDFSTGYFRSLPRVEEKKIFTRHPPIHPVLRPVDH